MKTAFSAIVSRRGSWNENKPGMLLPFKRAVNGRGYSGSRIIGKSLSWYYSIDSDIVEVRAFRAALSFM
jgi:hypothetical protein